MGHKFPGPTINSAIVTERQLPRYIIKGIVNVVARDSDCCRPHQMEAETIKIPARIMPVVGSRTQLELSPNTRRISSQSTSAVPKARPPTMNVYE
jgi:hypothetical protein